jgi:NTE family protein
MSRPEIGLALGGGVARGWVHIGVLKALIKAGIEPDVVSGTSIGAVVGALYLTGNLENLEKWARALTSRSIFNFLDFNWGGNSLITGERLARLLDEYLGEKCIEQVNRPFATVATELTTGNEHWLRQGRLVDVLRASYALPGVFAPIRLEERWLVDGALVNPCPTSVARALGGRFIIAVSLHSDHYGMKNGEVVTAGGTNMSDEAQNNWAKTLSQLRPDRLLWKQLFGGQTNALSLSSVMLSGLNILLDRISRARLAGDPPDILIAPRVGHIGLMDFHRADEMIELGERATNAIIPEIKEKLHLLS